MTRTKPWVRRHHNYRLIRPLNLMTAAPAPRQPLIRPISCSHQCQRRMHPRISRRRHDEHPRPPPHLDTPYTISCIFFFFPAGDPPTPRGALLTAPHMSMDPLNIPDQHGISLKTLSTLCSDLSSSAQQPQHPNSKPKQPPLVPVVGTLLAIRDDSETLFSVWSTELLPNLARRRALVRASVVAQLIQTRQGRNTRGANRRQNSRFNRGAGWRCKNDAGSRQARH